MPSLRFAHIHFKDRHAGTLRETPEGGTVFEYRPEFRAEIACALPRGQDRHDWSAGLHPVFEHLGPEGWLRERQARTAEIEVEDDLGILLAYGGDCIGAVSVHDPERAGRRAEARDLDALTGAAVAGNRTLSGVQPKLLVVKTDDGYVPAGSSGPAPYIAKFPTPDLPDIVSNEILALRAARLLLASGQVVEAERALVRGIETPALLVRRFDRTEAGGKLRLEDLAQVLSKPRGRDFSGKYDGSFEEAGAAIVRYSARHAIDLLRFFERIVVFALIGNCDCHLKNFSLLETPNGLRLAPAYDVVNTYVYARQGYSTRFGLRIEGGWHALDTVDRALLYRLGLRLGIAERAVAKTFADIGRKKDRVLSALTPRDIPEHDTWRDAFLDTLRAGFLRLCPKGP